MVVALRALQVSGCPARYSALHGELARAESSGEISEFYALSFRALLAMAEGSEFGSDYLEMAEAVASSSHELAMIASVRVAGEWIQMHPRETETWFQGAQESDCQIQVLWTDLLSALCQLGEHVLAGRHELRDPQAA